MLKRLFPPVVFALLLAVLGASGDGALKLDVLGSLGAGAKNEGEVIARGGKVIAHVVPGATVSLPPGEYKLKLPLLGGTIEKDDIKIEAGRTHTVLIQNVAVLTVEAKNREGKDPGFGVTVTASDPPHDKLAGFLSGDKVLAAPTMVDVKIDAPPQGYYWHAVTLEPGRRTRLTLDEVVPAQLLIQPMWSKIAMDKSTRVVIYRSGTQRQVSTSPPGAEHRFKLDPGDYDVYVENGSGKGLPYATVKGIHLDPGAKVEREVSLDNH